jgi:hypothetical protein
VNEAAKVRINHEPASKISPILSGVRLTILAAINTADNNASVLLINRDYIANSSLGAVGV